MTADHLFGASTDDHVGDELDVDDHDVDGRADDDDQDRDVPDDDQALRAGQPPIVNEKLPTPSDPMRVARKLLHDHETDRCLTLRSWRGGWMRWERSHWAEIESRELESTIYRRLEHAQYLDTSKKVPELKAWEPIRYKVANVVDAVAAVAFLPETVDAPSWLRPTPRTTRW